MKNTNQTEDLDSNVRNIGEAHMPSPHQLHRLPRNCEKTALIRTLPVCEDVTSPEMKPGMHVSSDKKIKKIWPHTLTGELSLREP